MKNNLKRVMLTSLLLVGLSACNYADDQTIVTPERAAEGNPVPAARDFARINAQHKVLVAIVDSGVDYNQPTLAENLHFKLDKNNKPVGFGYDLIGKDSWASSYIVRTSDYNPQIDKDKKEASQTERENIVKFLEKYPEFKTFLSPDRNVAQEASETAAHGTHVAGLTAYDRPDIGVAGYRVLPLNERYKNGKLVKDDTAELIVDNILKASQQAINDGARVINMSLGIPGDKPTDDTKKDAMNEYENQKKRVEKLRKLALANPNVVFVVAAGNDGKWIDEKTRMGLPCGVQAPNILCVGALDKNGDIANFSNILVSEGAFIMTLGVDIVSTVPTKMCATRNLSAFASKKFFKEEKNIEKLAVALRKDCAQLGMQKMSGTSMASPIIARQAAKVLAGTPELTGAQVIQALMIRTVPVKVGTLTFQKLRIEKPSWYKTGKADDWMKALGDRSDFNSVIEDSNDYFEFYGVDSAR